MGRPTHVGFKKNVHPKPFHELEKDREITERLVDELKPQLMSIIKRAFERYASAHTDDKEMQETEWKRFSAILRRML